MKRADELTVLDLFSGAGGMALGFRAAGMRCVGAVEKDEAASRTFARNFADDHPLVLGGEEKGDVSGISIGNLLDRLPEAPDLVVGGPPCQGFSRVGRAKQASLLDEDLRVLQGGVRDPNRNQLYRYFLGVIAHARPKAFVMENVPGMRELLGIDHAGRIAREAQALGYNVRYFLLNAAWYGVPQERWRLFFVGMRADLGPRAIPVPPTRTHVSAMKPMEGARIPEDPLMAWGDGIPKAKRLRKVTTAFQALADLPRLTDHLEDPSGKSRRDADKRLPYRRKPSLFARQMRTWPGFEVDGTVSGHWYRSTPRDFGTFARMAHGDRYPEALRVAEERVREAVVVDTETEISMLRSRIVPPYRNDAFADKWRKLDMEAPSWTLTAHLGRDTYSHIHYDSRQARMITIREAARLQSFPDGFEFEGNHGEAFRQIGNAVPPLLSKALAEQVLAQLREV